MDEWPPAQVFVVLQALHLLQASSPQEATVSVTVRVPHIPLE